MAEGSLKFVATVDNKQVLVSLEQMRGEFMRMSQSAQQSGAQLDDTFGKLKNTIAGVAGGIASVTMLKELSKQIANVRGEFQQLEVAFTTMLGSADKANKLMQQLTKTAATTPFDLKSVAGGAKQLLAYGMEADQVNDTLIKLGDIAAGVSIPLGDLVYLYGTTMVQGRLYTQDLNQFVGRGIPLLEELAEQFGVAQSDVKKLVEEGKVGFPHIQKAIENMTSAGSKFGGLMEAQSKTIKGQISNIEDSIDMMFNEIGQKSEGLINAAFKGVSGIVENYEAIGKAILALAGTYGTYRAALVVVNAVEKAHMNLLRAAALEKKLAAGANIMLSNSDAIAAARKAFFTKTIKLNTAAILKNTAAMLTNPAVLITAGIVALCASIYALSKALNTQERAQNAVNEANNKQQEHLDNVKSQANQAITTIQSETATTLEKLQAYELLEKIMPSITEKYTQEELAALDLATAQREAADAAQLLLIAQKKQQVEAARNKVFLSADGSLAEQQAQQELDLLTQEWIDLMRQVDEATFNALPAEDKIAKLKGEVKSWEAAIVEANRRASEATTDEERTFYLNQAEEIQLKINALNEQALQIENDKTKLTKEQADLLEKEQEALRKVKQEEESLLNNSKTAREKRLLQLKQELADINAEEAAYNKENKGGSATSRAMFDTKRSNAQLKFDLDIENMDKQFEDWLRDFTAGTEQIKVDMELGKIEEAIDLAQTYNEKVAKQNELFERQIQLKREANNTERDETLRSQYGDEVASDFSAFRASGNNKAILSAYNNASVAEKQSILENTGLNKELLETYAEMEQIYQQYELRMTATIQAATQEHNADMLQQDIEDYAAYCDAILQAARERTEELAAIENGSSSRSKSDVEADYTKKITKAGKEHGIDATEKEAAGIVGRLVNNLATVTNDQIDIAAQQFFDALKEQEEMLASAKSMTAEERTQEAATVEGELEQLRLQEQVATGQQKIDIATQIADKEQMLVYLKMSETELEGQSVKLLQTRNQMEGAVAQAKQKNANVSIAQMQKERQSIQLVNTSLALVSDTAKQVANTFGGVLSEKSKKALGVVSELADFGITAVQSIESVVSGVSTSMTGTTAAAVASMSALEKASFILTIISLAVQLIMMIVKIATQFTQNAKVNEELDQMAANIERMKELQRDLDFQLRNSKGAEYFRDAAKAAKELTKQIEENRKAYEKSLAEEQRLAAKYGEDSDKTAEQHQRTQEFKEGWQDAITEQEERFQELVDMIMTTDLSGWAESLADGAIEAALDGSKSFKEVWDEALEQWERDMYKAQLKLAYENMFKETFARFSARAQQIAEAGGTMSEAEIAQWMAEMDSKQAEAEKLAEMYRQIMEQRGLTTDGGDVEGSSKGVDKITQDQADELNARTTAIQMQNADIATAAQSMQITLEGMAEDNRLQLASIVNMASNIDISVTVQQGILDQTQIIAETLAGMKEDTARLKAIEQNTGRL
jgi:tape measure domain-containing protein